MNGRPISTLWLPGDKVTVMDFELRRAVKRDSQLSIEERRVLILIRACRAAKGSYSWWHCNARNPCVFCQEASEV